MESFGLPLKIYEANWVTAGCDSGVSSHREIVEQKEALSSCLLVRGITQSDVPCHSVQPLKATTDSPIHGAWKLLTYVVEAQATAESFAPMGNNPSGYVIFTPEGRLSFTLSAAGRRPPRSVDERAGLLSSMIAYTGSYRLEGDRWITQVDVAWNPAWVGTEQTRFFVIEGGQLGSDPLADDAQLAGEGPHAQHRDVPALHVIKDGCQAAHTLLGQHTQTELPFTWEAAR